MYGTVAWERPRKSRLSKEFYVICEHEKHDCGECFKLSRECNHLCCQSKLFEYASCMGYKIVKNKAMMMVNNNHATKATKIRPIQKKKYKKEQQVQYILPIPRFTLMYNKHIKSCTTPTAVAAMSFIYYNVKSAKYNTLVKQRIRSTSD